MSSNLKRKIQREKAPKQPKMPKMPMGGGAGLDVLGMTLPNTLVLDLDENLGYFGKKDETVGSTAPIFNEITSIEAAKRIRKWCDTVEIEKVIMLQTPPKVDTPEDDNMPNMPPTPMSGKEPTKGFKILQTNEFIAKMDAELAKLPPVQ